MEKSFKDSYYFNKLRGKEDAFVIVDLNESQNKENFLTVKNKIDKKTIVL